MAQVLLTTQNINTELRALDKEGQPIVWGGQCSSTTYRKCMCLTIWIIKKNMRTAEPKKKTS